MDSRRLQPPCCPRPAASQQAAAAQADLERARRQQQAMGPQTGLRKVECMVPGNFKSDTIQCHFANYLA